MPNVDGSSVSYTLSTNTNSGVVIDKSGDNAFNMKYNNAPPVPSISITKITFERLNQ